MGNPKYLTIKDFDPEVLKRAKAQANMADMTLREYVIEAVRRAVNSPGVVRRVGKG